jgi:hypothetical protein
MAVAKVDVFARTTVTIAPDECAHTDVQGCHRRVRIRPTHLTACRESTRQSGRLLFGREAVAWIGGAVRKCR